MFVFFFFNDTATTEIYTLSLHDALPIYVLLAWIHLHAAQVTQHCRDVRACADLQPAEDAAVLQITLAERVLVRVTLRAVTLHDRP